MRNSKLTPPFIQNLLIKLNTDLDKLYSTDVQYYEEKSDESHLHRMVILLEDRRYFKHKGIDKWSVKREIFRFLTWQKHGGASTIDMQFVRTITGYKERTIGRKLYEMILARLIQYHFTKWQILNCYLDKAFFGSSLIGAHKACQKIYKKLPSKLTKQEAAELAAMLVYPKPLAETDNWRAKIARRANYAIKLDSRFKQIVK